jgi:glutamate-ammonia-ligase adenylyltransferase
VEAAARGDGEWRVTIVAYDYAGELSLICGLLFVYGFSIQNGDVFTYELAHDPQRSTASTESTSAAPISRRRRRMTDRVASADGRRKIVDVFTVRPVEGEVHETVWARYAADLEELLRHLEVGRQSEAHGELARRVGLALQGTSADMETLPPIDVTIDNDATEKYTVLHIDAADTTGFLYEFTNALALTGVYVARVAVDSAGDRVQDTFYLTDTSGHKIEAPARLRELRAATVLVKHYTHLLPHSPNPESALLHFREFLGHLFSRPDWPDDMASLERPEVLAALARLLGVSDFLWDDFLRMQHHNLFPVVRDVHGLATARTKEQLRAMAAEALASAESVDGRRGALNAFKDREMFRVDMRHIQGHATSFGQFAAELTDVAEVVVETAYGLCYDDLVVRYGEPLLENGRACGGVVCALGKCGGRELGYASDIELMFVYAGKGFTAGPEVVATAEFYERLVVAFLDTIVARREGIFEIDLRLRPYGSAGSMAVSMQAFRRYFGSGGPAWPYERQALVRLRPIAGDAALGGRLLALRDEIVYEGRAFDVAAMRAMRERQLRHLVEPGRINAKFGPGGLVDAEYLVQGLQILHGAANPALRRVNTHEALDALSEAGVLSAAEHDRLGQAYAFLRDLINALRMVRGNARDLTVPEPGGKEFAFLARRLNYADDSAALQDDLLRHTAAIQELGAKLPGSA